MVPDWTSIDIEVRGHIESLTMIEKMILAPLLPIMTVYRLESGHLSRKGAVCHLKQDNAGFIRSIPRDPKSLPILIVRKGGSSGGGSLDVKDFKFNRERVIAVGVAMSRLNPNFLSSHCIFNEEYARSDVFPDDGMVDGLNIIDETEEAAKEKNGSEEELSGDEGLEEEEGART